MLATEGGTGGGESTTTSVPAPSEAQKELATNATQEYEKGNLSQCLSLINKLHRQRAMDPKVVHNHAVAAFYNSNQCAVEELKNGLNVACQLVMPYGLMFCLGFFVCIVYILW